MTIKSSALFRGLFTIILVAVILIAADSVYSYAAEADDFSFPSYPETVKMRVYCDGLLICHGYYYNDTSWYSFTDLYSYFLSNCSCSANDAGIITFTADDIVMKIYSDNHYLVVNGRYLYIPDGYHTDDSGRVYLSEDIIHRVLGFTPRVSDSFARADLSSYDYKYIEDGDTYYSSIVSNDDLFWLPKIINAEAGLGGLDGMIAVGNVILNRVADKRFPDTIEDVIFDKENATQFQPIDTGTINYTPGELAVAASRIILEGYNNVEDAIFFVESWTDHSWLSEECYICSFDRHLFYRG